MTDHIGQLKPDPKNARRHNSRNLGMIADALHEVGAARSIVIDEDNMILAGNATVDAAAQAGIERVRVIEADGDELIAVRRSNLTPAQKTRLALFDNRTGDLSDWDVDVLASLAEDVDLSGLWREDELAVLLGGADDVDPSVAWQGMPEYEHDDLDPVKQITVSFASTDDVDRFARVVEQNVTMATKSIWFPTRQRERRANAAYVDGGEPDES